MQRELSTPFSSRKERVEESRSFFFDFMVRYVSLPGFVNTFGVKRTLLPPDPGCHRSPQGQDGSSQARVCKVPLPCPAPGGCLSCPQRVNCRPPPPPLSPLQLPASPQKQLCLRSFVFEGV